MESPAKRKKLNKSEKAQQYFHLDTSDVNIKTNYKCTLCPKTINGRKISNLSSHLQQCHREFFESVCKEDDELDLKRKKLLLDCVELVTVNGRPFKSISDSGLISMNEDLLQKLQKAGKEVNLEDKNLLEIKSVLMNVAGRIREKIVNELNGIPLSILLDIGTAGGRPILGFSAQLILNGILTVRSLGMIELKQSHTGVYLAEVIIKRLEDFHVNVEQIVTITTDNGSNVLKSVRDMEVYLQSVAEVAQNMPETPQKRTENDTRNEDDAAIEEQIEAALLLEDELTEEEAFTFLFDETTDEEILNHELLLTSVATALNDRGIHVDWNVVGVACNAHTLQLCIKDTVAATTSRVQNMIKLCQKVAVHLRVKSIERQLESDGIPCKMPHLEVSTRWCSQYLMVNIKIR